MDRAGASDFHAHVRALRERKDTGSRLATRKRTSKARLD